MSKPQFSNKIQNPKTQTEFAHKQKNKLNKQSKKSYKEKKKQSFFQELNKNQEKIICTYIAATSRIKKSKATDHNNQHKKQQQKKTYLREKSFFYSETKFQKVSNQKNGEIRHRIYIWGTCNVNINVPI